MTQNISKLIKINDCLRNKLIECIDNSGIESKEFKRELNDEYIGIDLLIKIKKIVNKNVQRENKIYINEFIKDAELSVPKLEPIPKNPEFEQKMKILKAKLEEEDYQRMVRNVDAQMAKKEASIKSFNLSSDFKTQSGQLTSIFNIIAVIGGSFFFGYKAVEFLSDEPNTPRQLIGGFIIGVIVAIAEFYFLFKKLRKLDKNL